jgi:photosystem II stability/assembly factor-like uncharacterized protein
MKLFFPILLLLAAAGAQPQPGAPAHATQEKPGGWQKVPVATTAGFRGLSVVNEKVVWASGTEGTVIRTVNGGKNWDVIVVPGAEKLDFRGIKAFDDKTAVIISSGPAEKDQARIYRTTDGGKNWKQVFEEKRAGIFFDAVAFWDAQHGIVLSDPIDGKFALFATDDGGVTWKQLPPAALPAALPNEGAFAASNSCLVTQGKNNVWFATGGAKVARVFRSNDRGKTWAVAETPMHPANASSGIFSLAFHDAAKGMAVGGDYQHPQNSNLPTLMLTHDGGKTWPAAIPTDPEGIYFSSVAFDEDRIVGVGINGLWEYSGVWKKESSENLNAIVADGGTMWGVGPKGIVLKWEKK